VVDVVAAVAGVDVDPGATVPTVAGGPGVAPPVVAPAVGAGAADDAFDSPPKAAEPGEAGGPAAVGGAATGADAGLAAGALATGGVAGAALVTGAFDSAETGCWVSPSTAAEPRVRASRPDVATAERR
jgi:hypothetical protein